MPKTQAKHARARGRSGPSGPVARGEAARILGVPPARVSAWVEDGMPVARRGRRGQPALYDPEAIRAWREERDEANSANLSLEEERAKLARAQRVKTELQNRVFRGELVERSVVVAQGRTLVGAVKARLLTIPRLAVMRGIVAREQEPVLRGLVLEALREMGNWKLQDAENAEQAAEEKAPA